MAELYRDLTDPKHVNSKGDVIVEKYTEEALGENYWHCWAGGQPPKYKVWLDGISNTFAVSFFTMPKIGDTKQLAIINERLNWVADVMLALMECIIMHATAVVMSARTTGPAQWAGMQWQWLM